MSVRLRFARAAALTGVATAGILLAHELDYRLLVPDPTHRHDLLLRTGHGYLSRALFVILVAGVIAAAGSIAVGFGRERGMGSSGSFFRTAATLAMVQSGGFVALEATERLIVGSPPGDRLLLVTLTGIAVQLVAAVIGAAALKFLERAGAVIARAIGTRVLPRATARVLPPVTVHIPRSRFSGPAGARAPPLAAV